MYVKQQKILSPDDDPGDVDLTPGALMLSVASRVESSILKKLYIIQYSLAIEAPLKESKQ